MTVLAAFCEFAISSYTCKNAVRSSSRYITKRPDIGIYNTFVSFQKPFNLQLSQSFFIHLSISHYIARFDCIHERRFDNGQHKFNKRRGTSSGIGYIDSIIIGSLIGMNHRFQTPQF